MALREKAVLLLVLCGLCGLLSFLPAAEAGLARLLSEEEETIGVQLPWGGRVLRAKEDEDGGSDDDSPTDDTSECKKYKSGNASLALCVLEAKGYQSENHRVAHLNLYLNNSGHHGVCNITFWVEGMGTKRAVDYWPKWINLTNNEGYLAPGDGIEVGANIRLESGYPDYYIGMGFHACKPPDYAPKGYQYCTDFADDTKGIKLTFCEDKHYNSWMETDGTRTVHAQGSVMNNGTVDICFLNFTVSRLKDASDAWPEWFPRMTTTNTVAPLRHSGDSISLGADVPSAGFQRPQLQLLGYGACPPDYVAGGTPKLRKKPSPSDPISAAPDANATSPAAAGPGAPDVPPPDAPATKHSNDGNQRRTRRRARRRTSVIQP